MTPLAERADRLQRVSDQLAACRSALIAEGCDAAERVVALAMMELRLARAGLDGDDLRLACDTLTGQGSRPDAASGIVAR